MNTCIKSSGYHKMIRVLNIYQIAVLFSAQSLRNYLVSQA